MGRRALWCVVVSLMISTNRKRNSSLVLGHCKEVEESGQDCINLWTSKPQEKVQIHMWLYGADKLPLKLCGVPEINISIGGAIRWGRGLVRTL